jgi:hypothetical protein
VLRESLGVGGDQTLEVLSWLPRPDVQGKGTTDAALKKSRANLRFTLGLHVVVVDAQSNLAKSLGSESFADQTLKETGRRQNHPHVTAPPQQLQTRLVKPDPPRGARARLVTPQKVVNGE